MGLFYNFTKPGKGIEKDAPKKKGIFLFFELFFRKFFKLCRGSMLYFIFSIPNLIINFFVSAYIISMFLPADGPTEGLIILTFLLTFLFAAVWGTGPASAAFAYILRSFTREEHTWIGSDFIKKYKENFKQSFILMLIDYVMMFLSITAVFFYGNMYMKQSGVMWLLLTYISFMIFIIYTFLHIHVYQLMVTFKCTMKELIKSSVMLALGKAPMNLILTVITCFILGLLFSVFQPVFSIFLCFILVLGFVRFILEFYSTRTIQRINVILKEDNDGTV